MLRSALNNRYREKVLMAEQQPARCNDHRTFESAIAGWYQHGQFHLTNNNANKFYRPR